MRGRKEPDRPAWVRESSLVEPMEPMGVEWTGDTDYHIVIDDWVGRKGTVIPVHWRSSSAQSARQEFEDWVLSAAVRRFRTNLDGHHFGEAGWSFRTGNAQSWVVLTVTP